MITLTSLLLALCEARVPTGCVMIRSNYNNKYLAMAGKHSTNRRNTRTHSNPTLWFIELEGDHYLIREHKTPNELYAGTYTYDADRRHVLVWTQGNRIVEALWEIERLENGAFLIRSKHLQEHMYAADYPSSDKVFTWRIKDANVRGNIKFQWVFDLCPFNDSLM